MSSRSLVFASALLAACASPPTRVTAPTYAGTAQPAPVEDLCPMAVPRATVTATEVDGGIAFEFTTPGDAAEVRRRVRLLVRMHDERALRAATDDVPGGARLNIRPVDVSRAAGVIERGRAQAARLAHGSCPPVANAELVTWMADGPIRYDQAFTSPQGTRSL